MKWQNVGVREFRDNASTLLRRVREEGIGLIVTVDGMPAAVVRPFSAEDEDIINQESALNLVESLEGLALRSKGKWPKMLSATEAIRDERRDY